MKNPPACEQALQRGALAVGWEKERELATTSLEFEYLHRKNGCEMLVGGDDIRNDVSSIFHMVFNVCLHSHLFPLCADWWKSDSSVDVVPQGNFEQNSSSRDMVASSLSFSCPAPRVPQSAPESLLTG